MSNSSPASADKHRLDKWLWAARFFKTRSLAANEIGKGRVKVNGQLAKPSREVRQNDEIEFRAGHDTRTVTVLGLSSVRGPAPQAAMLYQETAQSLLERQRGSEQRRLAPEPAHALTQGRPTKRDRRQLQDLDRSDAWNQRWSASVYD